MQPHGPADGVRRPAAPDRIFWPLWVVLTTVGYAIGLGLDSILYPGVSGVLAGVAAGVPSVALFGAIVGGVSGSLQTVLLRRRLARASQWIATSAAGGAVGFVLGSAVSEIASNEIALRLDVYITGAIIQIVFGALSGAGIGIAQWLLIRHRVAGAGTWVAANVVGLTFGFSIPVGVMQLINLPLLGIVFGVIGGLLLGLTQWLWARRISWQ